MPRKTMRTLGVGLAWIALWAGAAALVGQSLLLPSPLETGRALLQMMAEASFYRAIAASMLRIVTGFLAGALLAMAIAALTSRYAWCASFFAPMLSAIKATPVASFIVLALLWLRTDSVPMLTTALVVLPIVWANLSAGLSALDIELIEMTRAFSVPPLRRLRIVYWPLLQPYLYAAITAGMGMAWKAGVAAEVIAMPRFALGSRLYASKIYLDTPSMFANTAVIILLSVLLEKGVAMLLRRGKGASRA